MNIKIQVYGVSMKKDTSHKLLVIKKHKNPFKFNITHDVRLK